MKYHRVATASICLLAGTVLMASAQQQKGGLPGEKFTPPAPGERHSDKLKVGDAAPDFNLSDPAGKNATKLSSFEGKKPVVLIFGSCT
jgi:hypothetical protein